MDVYFPAITEVLYIQVPTTLLVQFWCWTTTMFGVFNLLLKQIGCILDATVSKEKLCQLRYMFKFMHHSRAFYYIYKYWGRPLPMSSYNVTPAEIKSIGCISPDLVPGIHLIWRSCRPLSNIPPHVCGGSKSMARWANRKISAFCNFNFGFSYTPS